MFGRSKTQDHDHATRGRPRDLGLAKVPALAIGTVLVVFGLSGLLTNSDFPDAGTFFPDGTATGESWLGLEVNGWTNWFVIAAGALLLFGAAKHTLAKAMSVIVGLAMAAAAIIALIDGDDVLGLAAADGWTILGFAVTAVLLLANVLTPRPGGRDRHETTETHRAPTSIARADDDQRLGRDPVAGEDPRLSRHEGPVDVPERR